MAKIVGYTGKIIFDKSKSDGPPRKLLDSSKLKNMGWRPRVKLEAGLAIAYSDFCKNVLHVDPVPIVAKLTRPEPVQAMSIDWSSVNKHNHFQHSQQPGSNTG